MYLLIFSYFLKKYLIRSCNGFAELIRIFAGVEDWLGFFLDPRSGGKTSDYCRCVSTGALDCAPQRRVLCAPLRPSPSPRIHLLIDRPPSYIHPALETLQGCGRVVISSNHKEAISFLSLELKLICCCCGLSGVAVDPIGQRPLC